MTADLLRVALNNQDMAEMSARVARVARDEGRFEYVLIFQQEAALYAEWSRMALARLLGTVAD